MKKWMKSIAILALAAAITACGQQGKEYVGNWQATKSANHTLAIERSGDNFIVKVTEPVMYGNGKTETADMPAVYKDSMLEISNGFGGTKVSYVKDTDGLLLSSLGGSMEYRRVK